MKLLWIVINTLLAVSSVTSQIPSPPEDSIICPYPPPSTISPCLCLADPRNFDVYLECELEFSQHDQGNNEIFSDIISRFDTYKQILVLEINCDQCWNKNIQGEFSANTTGRLEISHFKLEHFDIENMDNGSYYFQDHAFTGSKDTLKSLYMDGYHYFTVDQEFLSGFSGLEQVVLKSWKPDSGSGLLLPNTSDWSNLRYLSLSESRLWRGIDSASFKGMEKLSYLNLDNTGLFEIQSGTFHDLVNLQNLSLADNQINKIPANSFKNLDSLSVLNLSNNPIKEIEDDLTGLNANTQIYLQNSNFTELSEASFRPFVEKVLQTPLAEGFIDVDGIYLECGCDVKWIIVDLKAPEVFQNAYCYPSGIPLSEVDPAALDFFCPDKQSPEIMIA